MSRGVAPIVLFPPNSRHNRLLFAAPGAVIARLEPVSLTLNEILYQPGERSRFAYFPTTAIVSLEYEFGGSMTAEMVGNEGMMGIALFMGGDTMPNRAVVQNPGHAYRLKGESLKEEFRRGGAWQRLLLRYTQARLTQMAQTAVCNRHHSVDQQLCRWLLTGLDRLPSTTPSMNQELIACMLGIRREGAREAAAELQRAGLIRYDPGRITVLNRPGLEARVCECYWVIKKEFVRLLSSLVAA